MAHQFDHKFFESLSCPTPVTWTNDVKQLFTAEDISHMLSVTGGQLNLGDYNSVSIWASKIYQEVASGAMPPPGSGEPPWTTDMVNTFGCWIQQGKPQ